MSARYWVLISDELARIGLQFPDGMRFVPPAQGTAYRRNRPRESTAALSGAHWYLLEDDRAPVELDGCRVELVLRSEGGRAVIAERKVLP
jgi:hypothetical protein